MCWWCSASRGSWEQCLCNDDRWKDYRWIGKCRHFNRGTFVSKVRRSNLSCLDVGTDRASEIAPAKKRGGLVVMNHIGMVSGLAVAFW